MKYFYDPRERAETVINYVRKHWRHPSYLVADILEFTLPYDFKYWLLKPNASKRSFWGSYIEDLQKNEYTVREHAQYMEIQKTIEATSFKFDFFPEGVYLYINETKSYCWDTGTERPYSKPVYTKPTLLLLLKEFEKYVTKMQPLIELGNIEGLKDQKLKNLENKIKNLFKGED